MQASNSKLYGITGAGGINHKGVIFEYDPSTNVYTKKLDFNGANGVAPYGSLIQASNGKLYGMTYGGGDSSAGVLFEYDPIVNVYTKKNDFRGSIGSQPRGTLIQASNGKLYGTTAAGGANNLGVIFEYDLATNTYTRKFDFNGPNGRGPWGSLIQLSNGILYGLTVGGGSHNNGVLFKYNPLTNVYSKRFNFGGINGIYPEGSLLQASNSKLYGMTNQGGITYQYNYGNGVLFEYDPVTNVYTKKLDFTGANGKNPYGSLIQASNGKLYGMTSQGGTNEIGVLFEYDPATNIDTKKFDFNTTPNGAYPNGSLMRASNGKLYGMTSTEGDSSSGVLFEYNPTTNSYTKKHDFTLANGSNPNGSLIEASNGKLYGMTSNGGVGYGAGVLFEYDPLTSIYVKKIVFNSTNGGHPNGSLIQASNGNLYGMTFDGGIKGWGVIFEYNPHTNILRTKHNFHFLRGASPNGSLMLAFNGKLYGMTTDGGTNQGGVLFEYDPIANVYSKKIDFDLSHGIAPYGSLIQASNGKLYGMTIGGGDSSAGVLFEYDPELNVYTKKIDFNTAIGAGPQGSLIQASNGKLYGMTRSGGINNAGVIFEYDPLTNVYTKTFDFNLSTTGGHPVYTNLIDLAASRPATTINAASTSVCKNNSTTLSVQGGFLGAGASWHWYKDSCNGTPIGIGDSITVSPTKATTYFVRAEGSNITSWVAQKVKVLALPDISHTPASGNICPGNSVEISASGNSVSYSWSPQDGLSGTTGTTVTASPTSTTTYTVTGTNANGCSKSKTIKVIVKCPNPKGSATSAISAHTITANWSSDTCATGYLLQYRKKMSAIITNVNCTTTSQTITGLNANTLYQWRVAAKCSDGSYSAFAAIQNFTTSAFRMGADVIEQENNNVFTIGVHPNPAHELIDLEFNNVSDGVAQLSIRNALGQVVMQKQITITDGIYADAIGTRSYPAGVYMVNVTKDGETSSMRFVKE